MRTNDRDDRDRLTLFAIMDAVEKGGGDTMAFQKACLDGDEELLQDLVGVVKAHQDLTGSRLHQAVMREGQITILIFGDKRVKDIFNQVVQFVAERD